MDNIPQDDSLELLSRVTGVPIQKDDKMQVKSVEKKKPRRKRCQECKKLFLPSELETHRCEPPQETQQEDEQNQQARELTPEEQVLMQKQIEFGGQQLFDLQVTLYMTLEAGLKTVGDNSMDGLSERMEQMRDKYKQLYESLYIEYGDNVNEYIGPLTLWAINTSRDVGLTYMENKKKVQQSEQ